MSCTQKKNNPEVIYNPAVEGLLLKLENAQLDSKTRKIYIDSAFAIVKTLPNERITRYYYEMMSLKYSQIQENEKWLKINRHLYSLAAEANDKPCAVLADYSVAMYHYTNFSCDSAFYYL